MTKKNEALPILRKKIGVALKFWRNQKLNDLYYPLDEIMELVSAHTRQVLDDLEKEAEHLTYNDTFNSVKQIMYVNLEAIKAMKEQL